LCFSARTAKWLIDVIGSCNRLGFYFESVARSCGEQNNAASKEHVDIFPTQISLLQADRVLEISTSYSIIHKTEVTISLYLRGFGSSYNRLMLISNRHTVGGQ
jgi:hypothetical protein